MPAPTDGGKTYTFKIRSGVKFHDGSPLTAADVAASFNKIIFPPEGVLSPRSSTFEMVEKVESPDPETVVAHDDGSKETYAYRHDGALVIAENAHTRIELERDALGRVIEERQDADWVRSEYDALGLRKRATSSKGFEQTIRRNSMGEVLAIEAGVHSLAPSAATGVQAVRPRRAGRRSLRRCAPGV